MIQQITKKNESVTPMSREMEGLHEYFPQCFNHEGKFDIDKFREAIESQVDVTREGRSYDFLGKSYARMLSSLDTTTVIRPDLEHNAKPENAKSENIYISGDNLDALHHLVKSYAGQVKCIYIDPPYNTGSDGFVYNDKFKFTAADLEEKLSISTDEAEKIIAMTSGHRASHAAWLTFMMPRLQLARELLSKDGVIFISIDDNEQAYLKQLCDFIFGEDNFLANIPWRKRTSKSDVPSGISQDYEWVLCYARSELFIASVEGKERKYYITPDFPNRPWRVHDLTTQRTSNERPNSFFTIVNPETGDEYPANPDRTWAVTVDTFAQYYKENRIVFPGDYDFLNISKPVLRYWKEDDMKKAGESFGRVAVSTKLPENIGMSQDGTKEVTDLLNGKIFSFPKPTSLIKFLIEVSTDENDIVLDFFSGSGTTAHAVMQVNSDKERNLKYILVQIQDIISENTDAYEAGYRTIDEIGMERIKRAAKKIKEENPQYNGDLGFKHYTLEEVPQNTLDKLETFDPNVVLTTDDTLNMFGRDTVLTTWLVQDGYGLNAKTKDIKLANYHATLCGNHLYMTDCDFTEDDMVALIDLYQKEPSFNPDCIVLFGYSFNHNAKDMLEKNKPTIALIKDIKPIIDVRY